MLGDTPAVFQQQTKSYPACGGLLCMLEYKAETETSRKIKCPYASKRDHLYKCLLATWLILEFPALFSSAFSPPRMKHCLEALLLYQPYHQGNMAFTGKYEVESDENYDDFTRKIGIPSDIIEKGRNLKIVTEVAQNGNEFTWSQHYPGGHSMTNKFTIGKEADLETMGGKKFKATVKMEDGKIVADFPNYHHTAEISGGKLVEISTAGGVTYKRISKRIA
ncbi:gastrotropin isoform X2 [Apteryx rowi]|uniref:gastrotropin isoform X2 n=1 Tax=Apteryx rowi TaxID=308060 RepID=UPI000E1DB87D|nr:gastrotropin isoform X2 [Apteryx rowi]